MTAFFKLLASFAMLVFLFSSPLFAVEETPQKKSSDKSQEKVSAKAEVKDQKSETSEAPKTIIGEPASLSLKLMVVNPSSKFKQTFPLKSYLPEEVKPEHILDKEDLEIGYDADRKTYYLSKEIELEPGASVLKSIRVEDIWFITDDKLKGISEEGRDLYASLQGTRYEEQGRLLLNNIEVNLVQIVERQTDKTVTAADHISIYRDNKKKVYDMEMDLMAMRRFVAASGSQGLFKMPSKSKKSSKSALPELMEQLANKSNAGMIPSSVLWKVIFSILIFMGLVSFLFVSVLHIQIRKTLAKLYQRMIPPAPSQPEKATETEKVDLTNFYPGLRNDTKDDSAA